VHHVPGLHEALAAVRKGTPGEAVPAPVAPLEVASSEDYLALVQDGARGSLAALFGLGVRTIVIDAGHGGRDPGAIGPAGLQEKEVTLDVATRLYHRLRAHSALRVLMTRTGDQSLSLKERVAFANARGADLFLSIHVNALPVEQPTVVETYYFGPQSDPAALRVAQVENRGSEYVMAEFREIIEKLDDSFKHQESRRLAKAIQGSLYRNIRHYHNAALVSWGIKSAPFIVLLGADMPSVLTEVTTLSNRREERRLKTESYRRQIASYLEQGLVEYLGMNRRQEGPTIGANTDGSNDPKEDQTAKEKG
jgi:N-acetylmuramoyl-L-alanine amidase